MLPIEPEPLEALRARYPAAIEHPCDILRISRGLDRPPSEKRAHVFDSPDGIRLMISRDRMPDGSEIIHFSASVDVARIPSVGRAFIGQALGRFTEISGWTGKTKFLGLHGRKRIPHWVAYEGTLPGWWSAREN